MPQWPVRRPRDACLRVIPGGPVAGGPVARDGGWDAAVEAFLGDKVRRRHTPATLAKDRAHLAGRRLTTFRQTHRLGDVQAFTADLLRLFEGELATAGLATSSIDTYHRILRNFLGWCGRHGYAVDDEVGDVSGPRMEIREPGTVTVDQERLLLQAARCERDRFLLRFMLATGLRRSEVPAVTLDDVLEGPDGCYLRVRQGKGRKDRIVPLSSRLDPDLPRELARYLREVRPSSPSAALFLTSTGGPLASMSIKSVITRLSRTTGIPVHAHTLRHTAASRWIAAGVPPMAVQRALGHSTMAMTSRYVHFDHAALLRAFAPAQGGP